MRIAIGLEYDGTAYNGWQRQRVGNGIQPHVETALTAVANESVEITCAGRTDTGVHASGQVGISIRPANAMHEGGCWVPTAISPTIST